MTARLPSTPLSALETYRLDDSLTAMRGRIFLTGTQALVRLLLMQHSVDSVRGLNTSGFVSGYRGSPLGMVDQQLWKARAALDAAKVRFLPAVNEELGATAVLGTQRVETDPSRTVDGVYAMWYGKGPGVDRAGDALRHGNAYGSSPHGGVLVVAGDDHGCVSSSMPHQSDVALMAWSMPMLNPADLGDVLEFGLYGWALSRFSGAWVGLKAISETIESGSTVDLDALTTHWPAPAGHVAPADGLHNRWPDLPSLAIEARLAAKLEAVRHFSRANSIDRWIARSPHASIGIVTCGKAHLDLMEALRRLGLDAADLDAAGVRIYKIGLSYPIDTSRLDTFVDGLDEILVVEEKGPIVEQQIKSHLYHRAQTTPIRVLGKHDASDAPFVPAIGELRPSRLMPLLAPWLAAHKAGLDRRDRLAELLAPAPRPSEVDLARRTPYFCSGCPHNTSTRVPEGSVAKAGIGCHFMASWMERSTTGLIQMGGEGVDWVAQSMFVTTPHVFQNLGDGTYFHSGVLAIRQAIAAKATLTYKILYNDAVAMTGGQPLDGGMSVMQIAQQVAAEGVSRVAIVSDDVGKHASRKHGFPDGTTFHDRDELDCIQRELREHPGVTVLIYEQTCAAEKRRRRKKGELVDPPTRAFINAAVCEGCGDCSTQSNCLSIEPVATPLGRKRRINQTSCNKDFSCVNGFCPSFVTVEGAALRKGIGAILDDTGLDRLVERLPLPALRIGEGPFSILITGVGGTGVVTVGALIGMAAHLDHRGASVLDFMGFAQKGGAVLSFVRIAADERTLHQSRIDIRQADTLLACDMVVGAGKEALQTVRHGSTRILANTHPIPNGEFARNPDAALPTEQLLDRMRQAAGNAQLTTCDAYALCQRHLGDTVGSNILLLGHAWQLGLIPVSLAALLRAIELNGVAVAMNRRAFAIGRLVAADPAALEALASRSPQAAVQHVPDTLDALIDDRASRLSVYGGPRYVARYRALVDAARACGNAALTRAVATTFYALLAVKDEYEVARLHTDPAFLAALSEQFEGVPGRDYRLTFHLAPPAFSRAGDGGTRPRKRRFDQRIWPLLGGLARLRGLRASWIDPFGYSSERRMERALASDYELTMRRAFRAYAPNTAPTVLQLAALHGRVRGYGHVKLANLVEVKRAEQQLSVKLGIEAATRPAVTRALPASSNPLNRIPVVVVESTR